jgi:hypothetical protein
MPREIDKRRPDFLEKTSVPVVMKDGQEWYIPKPMIKQLPTDEEFGYEEVPGYPEREFDAKFGVHYKAIVQAIREFDEANSDTEEDALGETKPKPEVVLPAPFESMKFRLYRTMLERNYNLTVDEVREILFFFRPTEGQAMDPLDERLWIIANGLDGPKPSPAGDALEQSLAG